MDFKDRIIVENNGEVPVYIDGKIFIDKNDMLIEKLLKEEVEKEIKVIMDNIGVEQVVDICKNFSPEAILQVILGLTDYGEACYHKEKSVFLQQYLNGTDRDFEKDNFFSGKELTILKSMNMLLRNMM